MLKRILGACCLLVLAASCQDTSQSRAEPSTAAPARFQSVAAQSATTQSQSAAESFCEPHAQKLQRWTKPLGRLLPNDFPRNRLPRGTIPGKTWTWINFWASWCGPCLDEMPLLQNWQLALAKEGIKLNIESWSIDAEAEDLQKALEKPIAGQVRWLQDPELLPPLLEELGIARTAAIPIHVLVDAENIVRCVRVGAVSEASYGAIKQLLNR